VVANLQALTVNWASPVTIDPVKNADREVTTLLWSSPLSWTQTDTNIQPNFATYPESGFPVGEAKASYPVAVAIQGSFESYYKERAAPSAEAEGGSSEVVGTIEASPQTSRLIVVGSAACLDDIVFQISSSLSGDRYVNSLKLMQNAVSWSTEDLDLMTIRSRGVTTRVLNAVSEGTELRWEIINYAVALAALLGLAAVWNVYRRNELAMELLPAEAVAKSDVEVR
jgi:ABC-2 type transport system permease protein